MRLQVTRNIDSEKYFMSKPINHGDWPFRFVIRVQYTEDWGDDAVKDLGKYCVSLLAVSPTAAKETNSYESAMRSCGFTAEQLAAWGDIAECEMLIDYGTYAHLWESCGNNLSKLMREARKQLQQSDFLFGFAMDRAENAIGTTGWDMIRGDVLAPLHRTEDQ